MFSKADPHGYRQVIPGIQLKTMAYGEKTLLAEFRLEAGSILPRHAHLYEQTGYLVQGRIRLTIGEETFDVGPGDSWCIPGNIDHSAEIIEATIAVEVFSPLREDYLPESIAEPKPG